MPTPRPTALALEDLLNRCQERPERSITLSLAFATLVAALDFATGDGVPLIVCYLPAVLVVTWVGSIAAGTALAATCCAAWLIDDLLGLDNGGVTAAEVWLAMAHGCFFAVLLITLVRLRVAHEHEHALARTDGLTGLINPMAFRERAADEIVRAVRSESTVSAAFIDCDNFKSVNDTLGHLEGDRLLKAIAAGIRATVRKTDVPARLGGDEFAVLLPETSEAQAQVVIERMREHLNTVMKENDWPVTFSIGVAVYETPPMSVDHLIHGADELMYEVKNGAKDAIVLRLVA